MPLFPPPLPFASFPFFSLLLLLFHSLSPLSFPSLLLLFSSFSPPAFHFFLAFYCNLLCLIKIEAGLSWRSYFFKLRAKFYCHRDPIFWDCFQKVTFRGNFLCNRFFSNCCGIQDTDLRDGIAVEGPKPNSCHSDLVNTTLVPISLTFSNCHR